MRIFFAFLILAAQVGFAADLNMMNLTEDDKFTAKDLPQTWGVTSNGVCSAVKIPREGTVETGLPLELYFKNVGDKPVLITHPYDLRDEPWIWTLSITGPRGRLTYHGDLVIYALTLKELKPGQVVRYTGTVRSPVWNISEKGRYKLMVKYESSGPKRGDTRPIWGGKIYSNEAEGTLK